MNQVSMPAPNRLVAGLAGPGDCKGLIDQLAVKSPRIALAMAMGIQFVPYTPSVIANFTSTAAGTNVAGQGLNGQIVQDSIVDRMVILVLNNTTLTGTFDALSNYFLALLSGGISATLDVTGAPRYSVTPDFTPLTCIADLVGSPGAWPSPWVIAGRNQSIKMSFTATVALPFTLTVTTTFRMWQPVGDLLVEMSNQEALDRLAKLGYSPPNYMAMPSMTG